jgi:hypothetical protein
VRFASAFGAPAGAERARMVRLAVNVVASQVAWFACVVGAARGQPLAGIAAAVAAIALHGALTDWRGTDALLVGAALALGLAWDTALLRTGLVVYASPGPLAQFAPAWILALWALFGTMLREPLRWLRGRRLLAAVVGGAGGALSYASAARLGACAFPDNGTALLALAAGWSVIVPVLGEAARRLDAQRPHAASVLPDAPRPRPTARQLRSKAPGTRPAASRTPIGTR